jgi:hypothetical protein
LSAAAAAATRMPSHPTLQCKTNRTVCSLIVTHCRPARLCSSSSSGKNARLPHIAVQKKWTQHGCHTHWPHFAARQDGCHLCCVQLPSWLQPPCRLLYEQAAFNLQPPCRLQPHSRRTVGCKQPRRMHLDMYVPRDAGASVQLTIMLMSIAFAG